MNDSILIPLTSTIPFEASEYLKNRFEGDFLSEIKQESNNKGQHFFRVYISHDNLFYNLKFNSHGVILEENTEPIWELFEYEPFSS